MKKRRMLPRAKILLSIGLLFAILPMLFKEYVTIPDFIMGGLMGFGITVEVLALIMMRKSKNRYCQLNG